MEDWIPQTELGRKVAARQILNVNEVLDSGLKILEPQITDTLVPDLESDLLLIGQSKGKFGGGRRRVFRQTQKKTREGNKPRFAAYAVVGNQDGIIGLGYGKARETVPAREKAIRAAKLNVFKIARGSGSWESQVQEPHTVPFRVEGSCGSVKVILMPAPKGKGLVAEKEIQKILRAAGISDVWSKTFGQTKNKINLIKATEQALRQLVSTKLQPADIENLSVVYGTTKQPAVAVVPAQVQPAATAAPVQEAPKQGETPLSEVQGIGPARIKKLESQGITSAEKLAEADATKLENISVGVAQKLIAAAKQHIGGAQ